MGAWGVAIFSDDLAADIRGDFRELIGDWLTPSEATDRLKAEYASSLDDPNEMPVFWIALALAQWKLGRLDEFTKEWRYRSLTMALISRGERRKKSSETGSGSCQNTSRIAGSFAASQTCSSNR